MPDGEKGVRQKNLSGLWGRLDGLSLFVRNNEPWFVAADVCRALELGNSRQAIDYMFKGLEKRKPDCFAVKQYKKYKLASGDICSK